jgi:Serine/threonine protein kinase
MPVTSERWKQVRAIFDSALELEKQQRPAFLAQACGDDRQLCAEVMDLLTSLEASDDFLEHPAAPPMNFGETPWTRWTASASALPAGPALGRGGMGAVYAAERVDNEYRQLVALKIVKPEMESREILRRFRNERQVLAGLEHPNIARLLDGGSTEEGMPYLVMEYIEGLPIDRYCDSHRLPVTERLQLFCKVCSAVQYSHQNLIVHRDLKPGNILVTPDGTPKLLDFGIAKLLRPAYSGADIELTRTSMRPMTPDFASPEQVRGEPITTASDVYSLGVILYRLLTGSAPYKFKTYAALEIEKVILDEAPEAPSIAVTHLNGKAIEMTGFNPDRLRRRLAGDLDMIVLMALRKEPQRRYASVERLAEDIGRHLEGLPVRARKDTSSIPSASSPAAIALVSRPPRS